MLQNVIEDEYKSFAVSIYYLGMNLDFRTKGKVKIDICKYVQETYGMFLEELVKEVSTPDAEHLHKVNENT